MDQWGVRVATWATGKEPQDAEPIVNHPATKKSSREVYLYFDHDAKVRARFDAQGLVARVDQLLHL